MKFAPDFIGREHHSVRSITQSRRHNQLQLGQRIARKSLLTNAQSAPTKEGAPKTSKGNGVLVHHRPARGDLYLSGESMQYSNCCFLDGNDIILAASIHGDVDVIRLPRYSSSSIDSGMTSLACRLRLCVSDSSAYSVASRYKLKPLQNGQAFAVGTPKGTMSIFATEHASTWSRERFPHDWKRSVHQDDLSINETNGKRPIDSQFQQPWSPFITSQWNGSVQFLPLSPGASLSGPPDWSIKPHDDALWDFRETSASTLLSAHAKQDYSGCARRCGVMDSRTYHGTETVATIDLQSRSNIGRRRSNEVQRGITAISFSSDFSLLAAVATVHSGANVENSLQLWDLRMPKALQTTSNLANPETNTSGRHFVSFLTPSTSTGRVMITSSSHQNRSIVEHSWFDLGRYQPVGNRPTIQQRNRNTTVFATNPDQDFMACYDNSAGGDVIRLFDPSTTPEAPSFVPRRTTSRKRRKQGKPSSSKVARPFRSSSKSTSSSSSQDDNAVESQGGNDEVGSTEDGQHRGVTCLGSYRPKLGDRYGLTTHLSSLSVNDSGTALVGGSFDGDIFVWRGA